MKTVINLLSISIIILFVSCSNSKADSSTKGNEGISPKQTTSSNTTTIKTETSKAEESNNGQIIYLTNATFKEKVYNYEANTVWKYEGTKPCIIDFYADWCGPCKRMSPIIDELAKEYAGKIIIYKVDTDKEKQLAGTLGITSLPTLLFCPVVGQPQGSMGAMSKEDLKKAIDKVLLSK